MKFFVKAALGLVGVLVVSVVAVGGWVWSETQLPADVPKPAIEPRGDVFLTAFYQTPANHNQGLMRSIEDAQEFARHVRAGEAITNSC